MGGKWEKGGSGTVGCNMTTVRPIRPQQNQNAKAKRKLQLQLISVLWPPRTNTHALTHTYVPSSQTQIHSHTHKGKTFVCNVCRIGRVVGFSIRFQFPCGLSSQQRKPKCSMNPNKRTKKEQITYSISGLVCGMNEVWGFLVCH